MKFIRDLIGRKQQGPDTPSTRASDKLEDSYRDTIGSIADGAASRQRGGDLPADVNAMLTSVNAKTRPVETPAPVAKEPEAPSAPAVNIWDMEGDDASAALPDTAPVLPTPSPALASAAAARSPARSRRTKTRLIGFEKSDGDVVDLFNDAPKVAATQRTKFPVGWIVVVEGPGRGESFALMAGMNSIGRGEDQAVQLDFGDNAISRSNHAAIVYDTDGKEFLLGHGGKSNIVRLNDKPVISNETLKTGDVIRIGETVLRFAALCDKSFNWSDGATGEDEDVAIA